MSNPIGHTFMYNIIIVFILIIFGFMAGVMSYYKAFKINNRIVYIIEKYEGYNDKSVAEIERTLGSIGYTSDKRGLSCGEDYRGMKLVAFNSTKYRYCIYIDKNVADDRLHGTGEYFTYGVKTYMSIDLPVVSWIRLPVFTRTNQIYKFTKDAPKIYG